MRQEGSAPHARVNASPGKLPANVQNGPLLALVQTGGESGADRAATDFAIASGIPYGGWVPRGGWAEDFCSPPGLLAEYPCFAETASADPAVRTVRNVDDADALLVLCLGNYPSGGTALALEHAIHLEKPHASVNLANEDAPASLEAFVSVPGRRVTLNVVGPRESEQRGLYTAALRFLEAHADLLCGS